MSKKWINFILSIFKLTNFQINPIVQQNTLGNIAYEITNYPLEDGRSLGNVNVVISDRKTYVSTTAVFYTEWSFSGTSGEMDNEAKGEGNSHTTEFRQYDPRIGRWLNSYFKLKKKPSSYLIIPINEMFTDYLLSGNDFGYWKLNSL